ncbi:MAG: hypothetical protein CMF82_03840 [Candidatus Marinimicrobia bacterium]|nr:hypothetical protein [Candidatus Neomarinimicrobiota bacterium]|tara:strand:- start:6526 stop:7179 length:654 start_codon:yes stop_codon:yes gene_type:complete
MNKCIVFDLDETLGYFSQVYQVSKKFEELHNLKISKKAILLLYKTFYNIFRPGIFTVLGYVKYLKDKYNIKVVLYTNSTMDIRWINAFVEYTETLIDLQFDTIINLNSGCRTSVKKTLVDLYSCTGYLKSISKILVIDNNEHKLLKNDNVIFVLLKSFYYIYENVYLWQVLHKMYKYEIIRPIQKNIVNKEYNKKLYDVSNEESLRVMDKIKQFVGK